MVSRSRHLALRFGRGLLGLVFAMTLVFFIIHLGPAAPATHTPATVGLDDEGELQEQREEFGLNEPLQRQYVAYLTDMATLDFGETWTERHVDIAENETSSNVNVIVSNRLQRTGWLWLWTGVLFGVGVAAAGVLLRFRRDSSIDVGTALAGAAPAFLLALVLESTFANLGQLLFGLDWQGFLVSSPTITRPIPVEELGTADGVLLASKLAVPPALAVAVPLAAAVSVAGLHSYRSAEGAAYTRLAHAFGLRPELVAVKHVVPNVVLATTSLLRPVSIALIGGTILVENVFRLEGLGSLLFASLVRYDYTTLQATLFVFLVVVFTATVLGEILEVLLRGIPTGHPNSERFRGSERRFERGRRHVYRERMRPLGLHRGLRANLRANPVSAGLWGVAGVLLLTIGVGGLVTSVFSIMPGAYPAGLIPSVLSQETIANVGHRTAGGGWSGTFLGLSPGAAWAIRVGTVYLYASAWVGWIVLGYRIYRDEYRPAAETPMDEAIARFRRHRGGMAGAVIVFAILVAAVFAPVVATVPLDQTQAHTSLYGTQPDVDRQAEVTYFDQEQGEVRTTSLRQANFDSASNPQKGVGPFSYDEYGRYHPLGTTTKGTDMLSELLHGARVYLFVAGGGAAIAGLVAILLSSLTAITRRDTGVAFLADGVAIFPLLPLVLVVSVMFYPRLGSIAIQLVVWTAIFGLLGGVHLWRTIGGGLDVREQRRVAEVQRSLGVSGPRARLQSARRSSHLLVAPMASAVVLSAVGFVVTTAALSYLANVSPATPHPPYEWGTLLWIGEGARFSESSHLFVVPAVALVTLTVGLYGVARGIRYALRTESGGSAADSEAILRLGGGG